MRLHEAASWFFIHIFSTDLGFKSQNLLENKSQNEWNGADLGNNETDMVSEVVKIIVFELFVSEVCVNVVFWLFTNFWNEY